MAALTVAVIPRELLSTKILPSEGSHSSALLNTCSSAPARMPLCLQERVGLDVFSGYFSVHSPLCALIQLLLPSPLLICDLHLSSHQQVKLLQHLCLQISPYHACWACVNSMADKCKVTWHTGGWTHWRTDFQMLIIFETHLQIFDKDFFYISSFK